MKIYDCFTFFNELDLLEIRLNELDSIVDYFVIVEGSKTFQNNTKPFYFLENEKQFANFKHKIIRLEIPDTNFSSDSWENEKMSWNYIKNALTDLSENDIVIISALDEIPESKVLNDILMLNLQLPICMENEFLYYYLNTRYTTNGIDSAWLGSYITKYKNLNKDNIYSFTSERQSISRIRGGWHFSFLGNEKNVYTKTNSYAHSEFNHFTEEQFKKRIETLTDPLGRDYVNFHSYMPIDKLPKYVQDNLEKYNKYIRK